MEFIHLLIALLLPWAMGTLAVKRVMEAAGDHRYGAAIYLGYGFLAGQVTLAALLWLQHALGLGISFAAPVAVLALAAGLLLWAELRQAGQFYGDPLDQALKRRRPPLEGWALVALGVLLLAHALPSLLEILWRPLFPWDAWSTWAARAKVWFAQGELVPFVAPDTWLEQPQAQVYTIAAYPYPTLVSLTQTWIALALGYWSDTLINLPWLLCALAICMVLYGHARLLGAPAPLALLLCYLLVSIPIIQIHVSLAGYADLWQAGYSSAALAALFSGWLRRDGRLLLLGLAVALAGVWIKAEGSLWLVLFPLIWGLLLLGRRGWVLLALCLLGGLGYWLLVGDLGGTLPGLGLVGLVAGELHLPGVGSWLMQYNDVWGALVGNWLRYSSWSLFWYLFLFALVALLVPPYGREHKAAALLLLLPFGFILFIFLFSQHGLWAEDFTAVNRLFIHFVPLWLLVIGVTLGRPWLRDAGER